MIPADPITTGRRGWRGLEGVGGEREKQQNESDEFCFQLSEWGWGEGLVMCVGGQQQQGGWLRDGQGCGETIKYAFVPDPKTLSC